MRARIIPALLVLALVGWAESLVPVVAMAAMKSNAVHARHGIHQHEAIEPVHACCPHAKDPGTLVRWAEPAGCETDHRCCFVQGRKEPRLPVAPQREAIAIADSKIADLPPLSNSATAGFASAGSLRDYGGFNLVLRI